MKESNESNIQLRRRTKKYSRKEIAGRGLWAAAQIVFRFTPRPLWGWRNSLLRLFGARIGTGVRIYPSVRIQLPWNLSFGDDATVGDNVILYALGPIEIGARSTISQGAHLCAGTHDFESRAFTLLKQKIFVGEEVWICADAFIGPDVHIEDGCVIGARAVVMKSLDSWSIVVGNPARVIRKRNKLSSSNSNE